MIIDSRSINPARISAEVCIVGGGVAGITLALALERRGIATCVVESGGFRPDSHSRDLNRGLNVGLPYSFADGSRSRYLGGSSNCWAGFCRPFDDEDFTARPWVPDSGWPIPPAELLRHIPEAHRILKLGPVNYDPDFWIDAIGRRDVQHLLPNHPEVRELIAQFSPPVRMGKEYREKLQQSSLISLYLYATSVELVTDSLRGSLASVRAKTPDRRELEFTARIFILAGGGIENARLLLASNRQMTQGIGNHHDLVGRYFMDHPRLHRGRFTRNRCAHNKLFDLKYQYHNPAVAANDVCVAGYFRLSPAVQERERLLNAYSWLDSDFAIYETPAIKALRQIKQHVLGTAPPGSSLPGSVFRAACAPHELAMFAFVRQFHPAWLAKTCRLQIIVESAPDPDSRIVLAQERDALGVNRVEVCWRLGELERRTFDENFRLVSGALQSAGLALTEQPAPITGGEWPAELEGTWHHMGTTRMHDSPRSGVVDRHCRVHELANLYVAGSSVFPTVGASFPTLNLVALALRLANRVADELSTVADLSGSDAA